MKQAVDSACQCDHNIYESNDLVTLRIMSSIWDKLQWHPKYLESFQMSHHTLIYGTGPLSFSERHYISIMAAARNGCELLVSFHISEFLAAKGNKDWLSGLCFASERLRKLNDINIFLAHRPWMLQVKHIKELASGTLGNNWSMSELIHAIVLLCHIHAFSSFVNGCEDPQKKTGDNEEPDDINENVQNIVDKMVKIHTECSENGSTISSGKNNAIDFEEFSKGFESVDQQIDKHENCFASSNLENQSDKTIVTANNGKKLTTAKETMTSYSLVFLIEPQFAYTEFAKENQGVNRYRTFRIQDYNWDHHAFGVVSQFYGDSMATLLDSKFDIIKKLTYCRMGTFSSVDTSLFRRAAWNYIQSIYGIRHDDYDYGHINQMLDRPLKKFIKTMCCFPEQCSPGEFHNIMKDFDYSEKVHLCLLVCESKFQSCILYSMRTISNYFS